MLEWTVDVGWTNVRPVMPDQHLSRVRVMADTAAEAEEIAMIMVNLHVPAGWAPCEMPTSSKIVALVL